MTDAQRQLREAMEPSLNWPVPGPPLVPSVPRKRRFWWRVLKWLTPRSVNARDL